MQSPAVDELFPDAEEVELGEEDLAELEAWRLSLAEGERVGSDRPEGPVKRPSAGRYSARAAANKRWREQNPDKVKEMQRRYRENNKARLKEVHDAYVQRNQEKVKEWQKKARLKRKARRQADNNARDLENRRRQSSG